MRVSYATPAIVLRARSFGESDKIVSFLTENHGKITGIAKGAKRSRRRFVNSLEPFSIVNLRFQDPPHSSLAFILAADLMFTFKHLMTSLEKISFASYLIDISDALTGEREGNRLVFEHLKEGLGYLEKHGTSFTFLIAYELKLLRLVGYQPFLDSCKSCGTNRRAGLAASWHFSPRDGGILCTSCSWRRKEILPLATTALDVLRNLQAENGMLSSGVSLTPALLREIRSIVTCFIQFHIGREIKSASFLYEFASM